MFGDLLMAGHVLAIEGALIQGANTVNNTRDLTGQLVISADLF